MRSKKRSRSPESKPVRPAHGTITLAEAMSKYRISRSRLDRWLKAGLPCLIGQGRLVVIRERDLKAWISQQNGLAADTSLAAEKNASWGYEHKSRRVRGNKAR